MEKATQWIGDALRGTIIVDTPEQMKKVVAETNAWIEIEGGEIVWKDMFKDEREDGYVGLHGKILMPFNDKNGKKKTSYLRIASTLPFNSRWVTWIPKRTHAPAL